MYAYVNASAAWLRFSGSVGLALTPDLTPSLIAPSRTSSYRVVGGLGTRRIGLFQAVAYAGYQSSDFQNGNAAGDIYGGRLSYEPTRYWTLGASVEQIINIASGTTDTNIAQVISIPSPILISAGSSTRTTTAALDSSYTISKEWSLFGRFGYTQVEYLDTPRLDEAWLADLVLRYELMRNLTLSWQYQYASVVSNVPSFNTQKNLVTGSATYKF